MLPTYFQDDHESLFLKCVEQFIKDGKITILIFQSYLDYDFREKYYDALITLHKNGNPVLNSSQNQDELLESEVTKAYNERGVICG